MFCLTDLCKILEIGNPSQVKTRLDDGVISNEVVSDSLGRQQEMTFINEDGLYDVILDSRKPQAKSFRKWVTSEVLPSIRKTGNYSVQKQLPDFSNPAEAARAWADQYEKAQQLSLENKVMKPKAEYFDNLVYRNLLTNIRDTAKQLHLKQKHFVSLLLENKFVYRDNGKKLKPYAEFTPSYFEIKDYENNGHTGTQLLITPKGKEAFRLLWGKEE